MSVEFEDETNQAKNFANNRFSNNNQPPKLVGWILKTGLVKNENQANYVLIALAIVAFLTSLYYFSDLF